MATTPNRLALFVVIVLLAASSFGADQAPSGRAQLRDWKIQSSCDAKAGGETISTPQYTTAGWHQADIPSTVIAALVADHTLPDPYFGANITKLAGYVAKYDFSNFDMPADSPYRCSWWYRTEFATSTGDHGANRWLHFDGINYRASIWLNGKKIADGKDVAGAFRAYEFNVKELLAEKQNVLAVEVAAPTANDLGITWWDWNPTPPDKDMGLW